MASESKQIKQAAKALHLSQAEQAKSVKRVGSLRGKLQRASRKIQALEAKMAELERRAHEVRNPAGQPMSQNAKGLRPACLIVNPNSGSFAQQVESPEKLVAMVCAHGCAGYLPHPLELGRQSAEFQSQSVSLQVATGSGTYVKPAGPIRRADEGCSQHRLGWE